MAIPEGRLSTTPVPDSWLAPENDPVYSIFPKERGPIAIEDTSEGLLHQNWLFSWNPSTGDITAVPVAGPQVVVHNIPSLSYFCPTFDQNGRVNIAYQDGSNSYLWWYDSAQAQTVTEFLGSDILGICLYLDDKRATQSDANDMLLWYTKESAAPGLYDLFMLRQRDRFTVEEKMYDQISTPYIYNNGMNQGLRGQLRLKHSPLF